MGYWNSRGLRGSTFEELINMSNSMYKEKGLAIIQKIPTPITPVQLDNKSGTITLAYFDQKSTIDYIGVVQGIAICFDAKETSRKSLPLQNIHAHQIEFMEHFEKQQGIAFLLVSFVQYGEVFYFPFKTLKACWEQAQAGGRKSIPYESFDQSLIVKNKNGCPVHFLEAINVMLSRGGE